MSLRQFEEATAWCSSACSVVVGLCVWSLSRRVHFLCSAGSCMLCITDTFLLHVVHYGHCSAAVAGGSRLLPLDLPGCWTAAPRSQTGGGGWGRRPGRRAPRWMDPVLPGGDVGIRCGAAAAPSCACRAEPAPQRTMTVCTQRTKPDTNICVWLLFSLLVALCCLLFSSLCLDVPISQLSHDFVTSFSDGWRLKDIFRGGAWCSS